MQQAVEAWIRQEAIRFPLSPSGAAGGELDDAIDRLVGAFGDSVEIFALGEPLHGGEAFLMIRNRVFQRLATHHGYAAIAVESTHHKARVVNDYVAGGAGSYDDVRDAGFSHGFGALEANRELVEWMRSHNAAVPAERRVRFYGFDTPTEAYATDSPRQLLTLVINGLAFCNAAAADEWRERIEPLIGDDAEWTNPAAMTDATQSIGQSPRAADLRIATEDLAADLVRQRCELIEKIGADHYSQVLHDLGAARRLLAYHAALAAGKPPGYLLGLRDASMADNLASIVESERGRGKVFAFAHNAHLQRSEVSFPWYGSWRPAGAHLAAMMGERYVAIGGGLGVSKANGVAAPRLATLEGIALASSETSLFLSARTAKESVRQAVKDLPTRSRSKKNYSYAPLAPACLDDFDGLAIVAESDYQRGGPALPE
jgi:erythromycin esterase